MKKRKMLINLIGLVSAHTGNDLVDHSFGIGDFIFGVVVIVLLVVLFVWLREGRFR